MARLATVQLNGTTHAARLEGDEYVILPYATLSDLFTQTTEAGGDWTAAAAGDGERVPASSVTLTTALPKPSKILCMGRNYAEHVKEMGNELPEAPVIFAKFASTLTGPYDDIEIPPESSKIDWEVELAIVIGKKGRRIPQESAHEHIAGYTVTNDVSVRDWQRRSKEWLAGKAWDATTPIGPWVVTADELPRYADGLDVYTEVDGVQKQHGNTSQFIYDIPTIINDMSTFTELQPGDVILTGTPSGVGVGRDPQEFLQAGQVLVTRIDQVGELRNRLV